jgi:hypothetical protein
MTCKIDHNDPDAMPKFLCRVCNPPKRGPVKPTVPTEPVMTADPEVIKHSLRRQRRRLRAEVKKLADELEKFKIARCGKEMIDKAERKWRLAYQELAVVTDKLNDKEEDVAA